LAALRVTATPAIPRAKILPEFVAPSVSTRNGIQDLKKLSDAFSEGALRPEAAGVCP
jgi:hypothetical protein